MLKMKLQYFGHLMRRGAFPGGSEVKASASNADLGSIPGSGRSPGEGNGSPLQRSGLENSMVCIAHGVAEVDTTEHLSHPQDHFCIS